MQIIDNLIVIHDIDNHSSQAFDLRLQDAYTMPLLRPNLQTDLTPLLQNKFASDLFLAEEVGEEEEESEERVLKLKKSKGEESEKTKEYVDFGFKMDIGEDGGVGITMEN